MRSYAPSYIKFKNRELVFRMFQENKTLSRAEIVRMTSMSFPTVMKVVDFLLQKNIVLECGDASTNEEGLGRKSKLLTLNSDAFGAIGLEVEGKFAHIGLVNLKGEILDHETMRIENEDRGMDFNSLSNYIDEVRQKFNNIPILGLGIGFPGSIDPFSNKILRYSHFNVNSPLDFSELFPEFTDSLDIPYFLQNDANLACLGEMYLRNFEDLKDLIYISLGTGLGAGIILDGELRHGSNFMAGEIGKFILTKVDEGKPCRDFEHYINIDGINERFDVDIRSEEDIDEETKEEISDYISQNLSAIINNLAYILDVGDFVISGVIPRYLGDTFYRRLSDYVNNLCEMDVKISPPLSQVGGIVGGAATVFDNVIFKMFEEE